MTPPPSEAEGINESDGKILVAATGRLMVPLRKLLPVVKCPVFKAFAPFPTNVLACHFRELTLNRTGLIDNSEVPKGRQLHVLVSLNESC